MADQEVADRRLAMHELAEEINLDPRQLRATVELLEEQLPIERRDGQPRLPASLAPVIKEIARLQAGGEDDATLKAAFRIAQKLSLQTTSAGASDLVQAQAAASNPTVKESAGSQQLEQVVQRLEEQLVKDRDQLMMALLRLQKEVQHLRYQVGTAKPRSERHRSWWKRLFG